MLHAITRKVSPSIADCELTHLPRQEIDLARAVEQHARYQALLAELGVVIVELPPLPGCPDAVFVEDTCVILDEVAIVATMGSAARRRETAGLASFLSRYRSVLELPLPGTLDGGDVLRIGRTLYVGISGRTNERGSKLLRRAIEPFGYVVAPVAMQGCLHLKTACTYLGRNVLLANPAWVGRKAIPGLDVIETHPDEPFGANALPVGDHLVYPAGFPRTLERLQRNGFQAVTADVSELQKAEAGVTCMCVLFDHAGAGRRQ
jgi:dimethylargininase